MEVCIVDYGFGNIWSLQSAVKYLGFPCVVSSDPRDILKAKKLLLPGVGAFRSALSALEERGLVTAITESILEEGNEILGICLGMQILAEIGYEDGATKGLGLIKGEIKKMDTNHSLRVPHVGFNEVETSPESRLFRGLPPSSNFYFVHSYCLASPPQIGISAFTTYGNTFVSAFESGNVYGTQFHPEKSQGNGLRVLQNFLENSNA